MSKLGGKKGFTIVELLLTCLLIGIVGLMISVFFVNWIQGYQITSARTDLLSDAENALDNITQDIRLSGAADQTNRWPDPNSPSGNFGWNASSSILILARAATDTGGNVIFTGPTNYVTEKYDEVFFVKNNVLYRRTIKSDSPNDAAITTCPPPGSSTCPADKALAHHVTNFQVKYFDPDENEVTPANARSVQLILGLKDTIYGSPVTANYTTRMVFRNE